MESREKSKKEQEIRKEKSVKDVKLHRKDREKKGKAQRLITE